ncbi:hypothetical protein MKZ38_009279 [Zalerion maritima]|uniref:DOMON domain-containing protein n=1 Tax=Zalerion maritima TaxID=339359 RepID=A0AAD5RTJ1_9PEZI|nr:hypothetical protein MKZ38_009279 [Zalerion maritima]
MKVSSRIAAAVALASSFAYADYVTNCLTDNVCISIGVPEVTASSGSGNLYFQMTAPTSYSWFGIGTGSRMAGSSMFIIYTDGSGNVTVSPRAGTGHSQPSHDSSLSVEVLAGSGVDGDTMTANFVVSNLDTDVASTSTWIGAYKSGSSLDDSSPEASISEHGSETSWGFDLSQATITDDSNPYVDANGDTTTDTGSGSNDSSGGSDSSSGNTGVVDSGGSTNSKTIMYIHALVASVAFVILMPFASVLMPLLGKWYIHAGLQLLSFVLMWIGFGLGVKVANDTGIIFKQTHTILGTVVICAMIFQPVFGWLHHLHYVKHQGRGAISYVHIWYGRVLMALGVINGGLGLKLANAGSGYKIAYAAVAGIMFVVYAIGKIAANMRKSRSYKKAEMHEEPSQRSRRPYNNSDEAEWRRYESGQGAPQPYEGHRYEGARYDSNRYA